MTAVARQAIPVAVDVVDQAYVSLFNLSGGQRRYGLDASERNVRVYLPVPTTGTRLVFFRADAATSGYTARVYAKTTATLNGSATAYVDLDGPGEAFEVVPKTDLSGWITPNRPSEILT